MVFFFFFVFLAFIKHVCFFNIIFFFSVSGDFLHQRALQHRLNRHRPRKLLNSLYCFFFFQRAGAAALRSLLSQLDLVMNINLSQYLEKTE